VEVYNGIATESITTVLVKIATDLNQPLFQLISAVDICVVNTFLNCRPYLTVNWVEGFKLGCFNLFEGQKSSEFFIHNSLTVS